MATMQLYVGADNQTGAIDLPLIEKIMASNHDGFTVWPAQGFWQGSAEPSAVILVNDDYARIMATIDQLKSELQQDAIGYQPVAEMQFA